MKMTHTVTELTHEDLVNLLSLESGGFGYWGRTSPDKEIYKNAKAKMKEEAKWQNKEICYEDVLATMLLSGSQILLINEEDDEEYKLSLRNVIDGIELNADHRPWDSSIEDGDVETGDCIMQYAIFGDIVFG